MFRVYDECLSIRWRIVVGYTLVCQQNRVESERIGNSPVCSLKFLVDILNIPKISYSLFPSEKYTELSLTMNRMYVVLWSHLNLKSQVGEGGGQHWRNTVYILRKREHLSPKLVSKLGSSFPLSGTVMWAARSTWTMQDVDSRMWIGANTKGHCTQRPHKAQMTGFLS